METEIKKQNGQAAIVLVLVVSIIVLLFTHVATLSYSNIQMSDEQTKGEMVQMKAEGYLENAALRYLRDASYTGEVLNEGPYSCTIVVTDIGGMNREFETSCTLGSITRKVGMQAVYSGGVYTFSKMENR